MPKFGTRKIGQAAFNLAKVKETQRKKFGPRKFGAKKAAIMAGELAVAEAVVEDEQTGEPAATTSVKQMAVALSENVEHLDQFIELELQRPAGPRKTALTLFLGTELTKEDDARDEVVQHLQEQLRALKSS